MGKWGGYHTDFAHLARGFAGNDRQLAQAVGEALLADGLLAEKPSVGQRHVFLNPRRAADIHRADRHGRGASGAEAAVSDGMVPGMKLPSPDHVKGKLQTRGDAGRGRDHPPAAPRPPAARRPSRCCAGAPTPAAGYKAAASRYPDDLAIIDESGTLTFKEVHERSNALAHALAGEGVGPGARVGDHVPQPPRLGRGLRGDEQARRPRAVHEHRVLRAAARRRRPSARTRPRSSSTRSSPACSRRPTRDRKRFIAWHEPDADRGDDRTLDELVARGDTSDLAPPPEQGKALILTSGTTGTPKGASRKQPQSLDPVAALLEQIPLKARERTMIAAPMFHSWGFAHFTLAHGPVHDDRAQAQVRPGGDALAHRAAPRRPR